MSNKPPIDESDLNEELAILRLEVDALRIANAALERQMSIDAEHADSMMRVLEMRGNELKEANLRQRHQNSFIQRVMDSTGAIMIVLGPDGGIGQVNRRCTQELTGADASLNERVLDEWLHPDERQAVAEQAAGLPWPVRSPFFEVVRRLGDYAAEHRLIGRDGSYRYYWLEASLQHNPQGKEEGAVVCASDITRLKLQQERLRRSENRLKEAQKIARLGHWELDLERDELTWSEEVSLIFDLDPDSAPRHYADFLELVHPADRTAVDSAFWTALNTRCPYDIEHRVLTGDGRVKWVHERCVVYYDDSGRALRSVGTAQDITEQREAEDQLRLAASVFDNSLNGILITDAHARIVKVNRVFSDIMGYSAAEVLGRKPNLLKSEHHDKQFYRTLWTALERDGKWQGEIWDRRKDGELIPLWQNISAIRDDTGRVTHYVSVFYDLSEQKQSAKHIYHLAYYDALTDLPNRQLFKERCEHALERASRDGQTLAVLFLDLDRFKHVNDSLGHPVGDELLCKVAQALKNALRHGDTVARLGGDEFIVLLENTKSRLDIEQVADKILKAICQPFVVQGHKLDIGTSIGISRYPEDGQDATSLIKHADLALYQAKEKGRGNFQFYEAHLTARVKERLFLEGELRDALNRDELRLYYQPQFALADGSLIGAEALLRWNHCEHGMIAPDKFIPIAEDSGLIIAIGEWVLLTACRQAKQWLDAGLEFQSIAVNLSGAQIERSDILATVRRVLAKTGLPPRCLELEITETYIMKQAKRNIGVMEGLRALGVSLAIDDFGTGQSSLGYLKRLPVDKLKIDRSFVMDIPQDGNDIAITRAILALGHSLKLTVLAEGVETAEQAAFLKELKCDEAQGYYFSRPLDAESFRTRLLEEQNGAGAAGERLRYR
ncbi:MAG: hypothetical protein Kow0065_04470 [Methylomicrobium sp.]